MPDNDKILELLSQVIKLKPNGEVRDQQKVAVEEIADALQTKTNLLLEAPTGSGKTLSYSIPVAFLKKKVVISTATKQLSEQIIKSDIPFLNNALAQVSPEHKIKAALLKGRDNYLCLAKQAEMDKINAQGETLFSADDLTESSGSSKGKALGRESSKLAKWADRTSTGDRTDAPAVSDQTWRNYSSTNAECPGKKVCPFGESCFAEIARAKAVQSPVVITNHAIVAQDLANDGTLLGTREAFIFDELHELDNYLSSAWGAELSKYSIETLYKHIKAIPSLNTEDVRKLAQCVENYDAAVSSVVTGRLTEETMSIRLENYISDLYNSVFRLYTAATEGEKEAQSDTMKKLYATAKRTLQEFTTTLEVLSDKTEETVRWVSRTEPKDKKKSPKPIVNLHGAPLQIGPKLQEKLSEREAIMIGLSATITVMGKFDIPLANFDLVKKKHRTVALETPFDYSKQAILYIPEPSSFPLPVGRERKEHEAAVEKSNIEFIKTAGGRSLTLMTTEAGVKRIASYYRKHLKGFKFYVQGEAPNSQLIESFKKEHESSLIGTMGFWHGLDAPGHTLILNIIDKFPFPSPDDPLLSARKEYADKQGRNGFMEIYVTIADHMSRQGAGRGIRSKKDKVVLVFNDTRLITKSYGKAILRNIYPGVKIYHDKEKVLRALGRLSVIAAEEDKKTDQ